MLVNRCSSAANLASIRLSIRATACISSLNCSSVKFQLQPLVRTRRRPSP